MQAILDALSYQDKAPLLFNDGVFLFLFIVFLFFYLVAYRSKMAATLLVLFFSWYFYYKSSGWYLLLFLFTVFKDFAMARWLASCSEKSSQRWVLSLSILSSLGVLGYFKYTNFFIDNANSAFGLDLDKLDLFLPIGISFYTFQSISYITDVYWRRVEPSRKFTDYAFYMSFFPHLVAGPIVKANHFLPQLQKPINIRKEWVWGGFLLIVGGLFKKTCADYLAQYNDLVFANPGQYSGFECLMAAYGYTLQIYCDFSGYSDMAIGIARTMGFDLGPNFLHPYRSLNLTDFWRRWHVSLSSWLREYVYIPMGGNRKGVVRTYLHLFLTMLIGGFWHGASWNFVLWGAAHGAGLAIHKAVAPLGANTWFFRSKFWAVCSWLITFHFVGILWIFFRAQNFDTALSLLQQIAFGIDWAYAQVFWNVRELWVVLAALVLLVHQIPDRFREKIEDAWIRSPWIVKCLVFLLVCQMALQLRNETVQPFIYFQF